MDLVIYTDGASRGNPGPSAYGFVIKTKDGVILHQEGRVIGEGTNNVAEYTGALKALEYVKEHLSKKSPHKIEFKADSQLVIRQLEGKYKVKNPVLKVLFEKIKIVEMELGRIYYQHVPRKENFIPDALANQALDKG